MRARPSAWYNSHAHMSVGEKRSRDAAAALNDVASTFRCSITTSLVVDPVTTADGQLYERRAIEEWFQTKSTSPNTGKPKMTDVSR